MNAVHGSILENLRKIEIIYEDTIDSFKKDRTHTSDSKEVSFNEFISSYFPNDFQVKSQSIIYSKTQQTNNIDCVILSPIHPRLLTPKREVILAEGVFCAIEVKPNISTLTDKSEFYRGILQIKTVKDINRSVKRIPIWELTGEAKPPNYLDKIPCVLFASKSTSFDKIIKFITKKNQDGTIGYEELPDLIVCLDRGIISYSPIFRSTSLAGFYKDKMQDIPEKAFVTYESKDKGDILVLFLRYILNFNASHTLTTSPGFILLDYLNEITTKFVVNVHEFK